MYINFLENIMWALLLLDDLEIDIANIVTFAIS